MIQVSLIIWDIINHWQAILQPIRQGVAVRFSCRSFPFTSTRVVYFFPLPRCHIWNVFSLSRMTIWSLFYCMFELHTLIALCSWKREREKNTIRRKEFWLKILERKGERKLRSEASFSPNFFLTKVREGKLFCIKCH